MGDATNLEGDSNKPTPAAEALPELSYQQDRRPFGGLEFQVSEVVGRLEAGVNAQEATEEEKNVAARKISAGFFEPEESSMDEILKILEDLVIKTDPSCENIEPPLLPTDAVTRAAILSHSIAALFGRLERTHASRLSAHIASETTRWMSHMFRLSDLNAYYHQEQLEGVVRVTRMLLHHKYPRYLEDGALAFTSRLPCVYSCVASPLGVVQHLCRQLGLPLACVRPVPVHPSGRGMDIEALDRLCEEDISAQRIPLLVLGEVGAPPLGAGSTLGALSRVCKARGLYLHLRGHALALAAIIPKEQSFTVADSVCLTPGPWFGVPGLPHVTFYRIPEQVAVNDQSKGVNTAGSREVALAALAGLTGGGSRMPALPLWTAVRAAGRNRLRHTLVSAFRCAAALRELVLQHRLRVLSGKPGGDEPPGVDIVDAISEASACVAFQFAPPDVEKPPPYYDKLNSWLAQVLQREAEMISIEPCETEQYGVVLRYCPLEGSLIEEGQIEAFSAILEMQLQVLRATVALREPFQQKVKEHPCLRLVHVPGWAGLGGVRYVPEGWEEADVESLNSLNRSLVARLRDTDSAFSCGDTDPGLVCVRFGMVTADSDVDELLELVLAAGRDVEESCVMTDMTEVLKKGIEEAEADLEREKMSWAWQEGVLRHVPVVGRVVSWWAPPAPLPPGRRLLLHSRTLQTTEDVYRYVQTKKESESTEAANAAPTPHAATTPAPQPADTHS